MMADGYFTYQENPATLKASVRWKFITPSVAQVETSLNDFVTTISRKTIDLEDRAVEQIVVEMLRNKGWRVERDERV